MNVRSDSRVVEKTVRHVSKPRACYQSEKHLTQTPGGLCLITPGRLASMLHGLEDTAAGCALV